MICHNKKEKRELSVVAILLITIVFGGSFLVWHHMIDGVYVNRVLEFRDGVDPLDLQLVQKEYHRGEMVSFLTNVCKTRDAKAITQWTLANDRLIFFAPGEAKEFPVRCYPEDEKNRITVDVHQVPADAKYGDHYFVGVSTQVLPDGRTRKQYYKTEPFRVIP